MKLKIKVNFWLATAIVAGVVILGGALVTFSSPSLSFKSISSSFGSILSALKDKLPGSLRSDVDRAEDDETGARVIVDVEEKEVADERPDSMLGGSPQIKNNSTNYQNPPINQTPWGQGPSNQTSGQTSSSGGGSSNNSDNQTPWQQGPSQSSLRLT